VIISVVRCSWRCNPGKPASGHANSRQLAGSCRLTLCAGWLVAHPGNLRDRAEAVLIPGSVASRLPFSAALNQAV